jgi:hypothetical protein
MCVFASYQKVIFIAIIDASNPIQDLLIQWSRIVITKSKVFLSKYSIVRMYLYVYLYVCEYTIYTHKYTTRSVCIYMDGWMDVCIYMYGWMDVIWGGNKLGDCPRPIQ